MEESEEDGSDYYDEEDEKELGLIGSEGLTQRGSKDQGAADQGPLRKQPVEMRLIVKQAQVNVLDSGEQVRVEFTRNGKSLSTDFKLVDEETGIVNIKQSFNQKIQEKFDKDARKWVPDFIELAIFYGDDIVGACRFDLTQYIDQGARNEKACMIQPDEEPQ